MEELGQLVAGLEHFIRHYGVVAVMVILAFEALGAPLPGEALLIFASILAGRGEMSLPALLIFAWAGSVVGDNVGYLIGRSLGRAAVARYGAKIGLHRGALQRRRGGVRKVRRSDRHLRSFRQYPAPAQRCRGGDLGHELVAVPAVQRARRRALGGDVGARRLLPRQTRIQHRRARASRRGHRRSAGRGRTARRSCGSAAAPAPWRPLALRTISHGCYFN